MYRTNIFRVGVIVAVAFVMSICNFESFAADSDDQAATATAKASIQTQTTDDSSLLRADSAKASANLSHRVVAYYFHGNVRCVSCRKIEAYTNEAIDSAFGAALKSGALEWKVVNTDSAQNEHYLQDYQLYTKSVILSDLHNDKQTRWKNLEKVWELLGNQAKFHMYIRDELRMFLDSTK